MKISTSDIALWIFDFAALTVVLNATDGWACVACMTIVFVSLLANFGIGYMQGLIKSDQKKEGK